MASDVASSGVGIKVGARCSFCHSYQPIVRREVNADDYTQVFRFFCSTAHEAAWGTNQQQPASPARSSFFNLGKS